MAIVRRAEERCPLQLAVALSLPFLACVMLTITIGPASFSLRWSLGMGLLYVVQAALLRNFFLEKQFKVQSPSPPCISFFEGFIQDLT